jgi:diaminohydroxyphosphoribosylaminopyrimidine deaminase / 5-amino-6-(5-phosphoribosylamino)uracil reductase
MPSTTSPITETIENPSPSVFMQRCLHLASLGAGNTAPNPLVGAILVHEGRIIGEGFHEKYGCAHAEVNCIESVKSNDRPLISSSTLFVSLEPCCHQGKTPPCTDLIIREKIPTVVIGCRDPFPLVNGKGIEKLEASGVRVEYPVLEESAKEKNRRFFTFHQHKRPYIILKWAQSANLKMAGEPGKRIMISNTYSNRLVHKWRTEEAGILIGTKTALMDNPELTTRLWPGKNPIRIVLDQKLRLPDSLKIFDGSFATIILNGSTDLSAGNRLFKKINPERPVVIAILDALHSLNILSILVEGGAKLLHSFIVEDCWDELRIITNNEMNIPEGISAPEIRDAKLFHTDTYGSDTIRYYASVRV